MKNVQNGIYFLVSDSVSGDNSNLFKDYRQALKFYNDDQAGADGEYDVQLSVVHIEDNEIVENIAIEFKSVRKQSDNS
jgi:hypothetical protein